MTKQNKIEKIQEVLEENLNLQWVDRLVYNIHTDSYHTAGIWDFSPNKPTYTYLRDKKNRAYRAKVVLNNESFIIKMNGMKIDASEHWQELLQEEMVVTTLE